MQRLSPESEVIDAMNRVLEAERVATVAIEDSLRRCEAELESARAARHAILERARRRAALAHSIAAAQVERDIAALEAQCNDDAPGREAFGRLTDQAVRALAERLTTEDAGPT